jgi:hypothetical protein
MGEFMFYHIESTIMYYDNQSAIQLAHNHVSHNKTKHVKIQCIRELQDVGLWGHVEIMPPPDPLRILSFVEGGMLEFVIKPN